MSKIGNIDIGCVTKIQKTERKSYYEFRPASNLATYTQNLINEIHEWRIEGFLENPTQSNVESIKALRNSGRICLIDLDDIKSGEIAWGKLIAIDWIDEEEYADIVEYEMLLRIQPAVGLTWSRTTNVYLLDLDGKTAMKWLDPHFGKCNKTYNSTRSQLQYSLNIKNDSSSDQTALIEIQVGDNISSVSISPSTGWSQATGTRGESVTTGTISRSLGCDKRVLLKRTFSANENVQYTITLTHDALPIITYVEGGLNP